MNVHAVIEGSGTFSTEFPTLADLEEAIQSSDLHRWAYVVGWETLPPYERVLIPLQSVDYFRAGRE